jgi:DNA-binding transcriptional LysR family regulator
VLLTPLLTALRREAPAIDLGVRNLVGQSQFEAALGELDQRTLDVAISPLVDLPARFEARALYDEDFVLVRREGHPIGRKFTLASYAAATHVLVSISADPYGQVDKMLAEHGLTRRVMLTVQNFLHALAVVAETDLVVAVPRRFAMQNAARYRVEVSEPPIPLLSSPVRAIATRAATADAGLAWFLELMERTARLAVSKRRRRPD